MSSAGAEVSLHVDTAAWTKLHKAEASGTRREDAVVGTVQEDSWQWL